MKFKYAIYGAGSLGIVLSAYLAKSGEIFDIIDRNPKSVEALNSNRILQKVVKYSILLIEIQKVLRHLTAMVQLLRARQIFQQKFMQFMKMKLQKSMI